MTDLDQLTSKCEQLIDYCNESIVIIHEIEQLCNNYVRQLEAEL